MHGLVGVGGENHVSYPIALHLTFDTGSLSETGWTIG